MALRVDNDAWTLNSEGKGARKHLDHNCFGISRSLWDVGGVFCKREPECVNVSIINVLNTDTVFEAAVRICPDILALLGEDAWGRAKHSDQSQNEPNRQTRAASHGSLHIVQLQPFAGANFAPLIVPHQIVAS